MTKFKPGDKVKRIGGVYSDLNSSGKMTVGGIYTVKEVNTVSLIVEEIPDQHWDICRFELYQFDMNEKWFIRVHDKAHSEAVQQWLFDKGFDYEDQSKTPSPIEHGLITNGYGGKTLYNTAVSSIDFKIKAGAKEIKITTKNVVDQVIYPEVESEQEKRIRELQETINKAQEQIEQLRKGM